MLKLVQTLAGIALLGVVLASCQSGSSTVFNASNTPSDWVGETPAALISSWGNPTQVINNNGYQYFIYMRAENIIFGDDEGQAGVGPLQMINGIPQATPVGNLFCQTTFVVEAGQIVKALWQGDGCNY